MFDDIIDFKSMKGFPQYAEVLKDKCMDTFALSDEKSDGKSYGKGSGKKKAKAEKAKAKKPKKLMWNSIVQVMFEKNDKAYFKYDYEDTYREMPFTNKIAGTRGEKKKNDAKVGFNTQKYPKPIGITTQKKKDLMKMCKKGLIPKAHHGFYHRLQINSGKTDDEVVQEADESDVDEDDVDEGEDDVDEGEE